MKTESVHPTGRFRARYRALIMTTHIVLVMGCVQIPSQSVELVEEIKQQMRENEAAHLSLMALFFERQRMRVEDFIDRRWTPEFLEAFFAEPGNDLAWRSALEAGAEDRLRYLQGTTGALVQAIDSERRTLLQPLEVLEVQATRALRDRYTQLYRTGEVLGTFLQSASKFTADRDRRLASLGIDTGDIDHWVEESDRAITTLMSVSEDVRQQRDYLQAFLDRLRQLADSGLTQTEGD